MPILGKSARHTAKLVRHRKKITKDDVQLSILALPTLIWYLCFAFLPMFGIIIAFKKFEFRPGHGFISNLLASPWSGFDHFTYLFKSNDAFMILRNTLGYNLLFILLGVLLPSGLAVFITQLHSRKLARGVQTAMFLPYFMSWVVVTYFVLAFLSYDKGLLNSFLNNMGLESIQWYMESKYWPFFLVLLNVWKNVGYGMVIYLATISGIDATLYEAAVIDGATKWQQIKYITIPLLKTVMIMMFILSIGRIFYSDFGLFYQVPRASASLYTVTETLDTYVYRALSQTADISKSSASAFIQSVAGCITILSANWVVKKIDKDHALL